MIAHFVLHVLLGAAFLAWGIRMYREGNAAAVGSNPAVASANRTRRLLGPPLIVLGAAQIIVVTIRTLHF